jgi:hypothetical protein
MKFLTVKSNALGSRFIRWGLRAKASHFAVCFDEDSEGSGIVFHSHANGAQLEFLQEFLKKYELVRCLEFTAELTLQDEEAIYRGLLRKYASHKYDYKALLYWVWRGILLRFFSISLPSKNAWQKKGYSLCTGLAGGIKWIESWAEEKHIDLEMISPDDLFYFLLKTGYIREAAKFKLDNSVK